MSQESYGEAVALLSLYMVCTLPLAPVFLLVTQRVVDARLRQRDGDIRALLLTLARRTCLIGVLLVSLVLVGREAVAGWLHVTDPWAPVQFALSVAVSALYLLVVAVLLGRMHWAMANTLPVALGATRILFSLLFVRPGFEVAGTFAAITASALLCLVIGARSALRGLARGGRYHALHVEQVGLAITVNLAFWFLVQVDTIYVNRALPAVAERGYAAASALGKMLVYVPVAVGNVLFPLLIAAQARGSGRSMLLRMLLLATLLDGVGLAIIAAAPERLLLLTLGATHLSAASLLVPVAAVLAPFALASVFMYDALARHDRVTTAIFAVAAAAAAFVLAFVRPSLPGLFTLLVTAAVITIIGGALRALAVRRLPDSVGRVPLDPAASAGGVPLDPAAPRPSDPAKRP